MKKLGVIPPAPGGAVQSAVSEPREPVMQMLAPEPEKDFEDSLPESTAQTTIGDAAPRRKRRSKAEMDAARGEATPQPSGPVDVRLERAKAKFTSLGGGSAIKAGFVAVKKPLNAKEDEDVDDYFYLVGSKGGLDPTQSWFTMFICALLLVARLVFVRTDLGDQLKEFLFAPKKEKKENDGAKDDKP